MAIENHLVSFKPHSKQYQLLNLLSDFKPRTVKEIKLDMEISNISKVANLCNEVIQDNGFEIQTQLHPHQKDWFWLLVEKRQGGKNYAG